MAKAWKDVIASPQYQQLSPAQQSEAQEQYFNEVVAPRAGDQASQAKAAFYSAYPLPGQQPDNPLLEAGKGLAQSAVNVANIIPEMGDAVQSAAVWAGGKLGIGDGTYTPAQRFALPDALQPKDEYAKIGAEIGPYLIPGVGAERTAAALGSVAGAGRAERFATKAADMLAENVPGALAQNSSVDNPEGLAKDLAIGTLASGAVRAVAPAVNGVASLVKRGIRPSEKQAASAGVEPEVKSAFTPEQEKCRMLSVVFPTAKTLIWPLL